VTLFAVSGRGRVASVALKTSAAAGSEVVVGLAFRLSVLSDAERSALFDYYQAFVDVEIAAVNREVERLPMDEELARVQREPGQEERMRPGPDETCIDCGELIGDDPDASFHVPLAGPPSPLCGGCTRLREAAEIEAAVGGGSPADTDPANQSWCPTCGIWLAVPIGGVCEVCGTGTVSEPPETEKADWQRIADGEDLEPVEGADLASTPAEADFAVATATEVDEPIGDNPLPERPDEGEAMVATTPIRRRGR
jgi:hypothetical protein